MIEHVILGKSQEEMSRKYHVSAHSLSCKLYRARNSLKDKFGDEFEKYMK
jgi:hypothetical protein